MAISLVIADDHRIILEGLEQLFQRENDFVVLATCTSGDEALVAVREKKPDILVLDFHMPGRDGLSVLQQIREEPLDTRVVLLTAAMDEDEVLRAVKLGASGLVLKESAAVLLVDCVRRVSKGERMLDQSLVVRAIDRMFERETAIKQTAEILSPRETEIVRMVVVGMRNKEIAAKLFIGEGTVKTHLHAIYRKLGVHGRVELTVYARERGLV